MKRAGMVAVIPVCLLLAGSLLYLGRSTPQPESSAAVPGASVAPAVRAVDGLPDRALLDISVHTLRELRILFERAELLADRLAGHEASVVLVLHGPEVDFFAAGNYDRYHDVVDQAARLDARGIVDIRICRSMMQLHGIPRHDIPGFIEQVPDGAAEIKRLLQQGYVYF